VFQDEATDFGVNLGAINAFYNIDTGLWRFGTITDDDRIRVDSTNTDFLAAGLQSKFVGLSTPGTIQTLITQTVGAGLSQNLHDFRIVGKNFGVFEIDVDGDIIGAGSINPVNNVDHQEWKRAIQLTAGQVVSVKFLAHSSQPANNLYAFLSYSEE
jgi:hypothetical protein